MANSSYNAQNDSLGPLGTSPDKSSIMKSTTPNSDPPAVRLEGNSLDLDRTINSGSQGTNDAPNEQRSPPGQDNAGIPAQDRTLSPLAEGANKVPKEAKKAAAMVASNVEKYMADNNIPCQPERRMKKSTKASGSVDASQASATTEQDLGPMRWTFLKEGHTVEMITGGQRGGVSNLWNTIKLDIKAFAEGKISVPGQWWIDIQNALDKLSEDDQGSVPLDDGSLAWMQRVFQDISATASCERFKESTDFYLQRSDIDAAKTIAMARVLETTRTTGDESLFLLASEDVPADDVAPAPQNTDVLAAQDSSGISTRRQTREKERQALERARTLDEERKNLVLHVKSIFKEDVTNSGPFNTGDFVRDIVNLHHYAAQSELPVERTVGAAIQRLFHITDCSYLANQSLTYPWVLGVNRSSPRPDQVNRRRAPTGTWWKPITLIAEAKAQVEYDIQKDLPADKPHAVVQMACGVTATMQLFIIHLVESWKAEWEIDRKTLKMSALLQKDIYQIPSWMRVYGIVYSRDGLQIWCYFPYYKIEYIHGSAKMIWSFMAMPMDWNLNQVVKVQDYVERMQLFKAFLILKRAAENLVEALDKTPLLQPKEFITLDQTWPTAPNA